MSVRARVITAAEAGSVAPASVVLEPEQVAAAGLAHGFAPRLTELAQEQVELARRDGYEEGYRAGQNDGLRSAVAGRHAAVAAAAQRLAEVAACAAVDRQALVEAVVADAVDLVVELLEVMAGAEAVGAAVTRQAVQRALAIAPSGHDLVVRLSPSSGLTASEVATLVRETTISVEMDPALDPSGCVVEAGPCRIDAQVGSAIARVREVLVHLREAPSLVEPA